MSKYESMNWFDEVCGIIKNSFDEGVAQFFTMEMNNRKIIGTVGAHQMR